MCRGGHVPLHCHPLRFCLNPSDSGRKICKEAIFILRNEFLCIKISNEPDVHAVGFDFNARGPKSSCALLCF